MCVFVWVRACECVFCVCYAFICIFVRVCVFILVRACVCVHVRIPVPPISLFRNKRGQGSAASPRRLRVYRYSREREIAFGKEKRKKEKKYERCIVFRNYKSSSADAAPFCPRRNVREKSIACETRTNNSIGPSRSHGGEGAMGRRESGGKEVIVEKEREKEEKTIERMI